MAARKKQVSSEGEKGGRLAQLQRAALLLFGRNVAFEICGYSRQRLRYFPQGIGGFAPRRRADLAFRDFAQPLHFAVEFAADVFKRGHAILLARRRLAVRLNFFGIIDTPSLARKETLCHCLSDGATSLSGGAAASPRSSTGNPLCRARGFVPHAVRSWDRPRAVAISVARA